MDAANAAGDTALIMAVKKGNIVQASKLIERKANVNRSNHYGNTPLHYAAFWRNEEMVKLLVEQGKARIARMNVHDKAPSDVTSGSVLSLLKEYSESLGHQPPIDEPEIATNDGNADKNRNDIDVQQTPVSELQFVAASTVQMLDILSHSKRSTFFKALWRGKVVCVKIPMIPFEPTDSQLQTTTRELQLIHTLSHPNLEPILAVCLDVPDICFLNVFMEYGDLRAYLSNPAVEMTPAHTIKLALDTCSALDYLHQKNVIHGNLKTSNIMVIFIRTPCTKYGVFY